jgi:transposase
MIRSLRPVHLNIPATYYETLYRQRRKVENVFSKLNDWRPILMRYDRCAHTSFNAICIAATINLGPVNESDRRKMEIQFPFQL